MIRIILKNLLRRKSRTFLTMVGIIIGVAAIVGLVSISEGLQQEANTILGEFQGITVSKETNGGVGGFGPSSLSSNLPLNYQNEIIQIQGVSVVSPEIETRISSIEEEPIELFDMITTRVIGVEPNSVIQLKRSYFTEIVEGRPLESSDKYSCIIGSDIAEDYRKRVGDKIKIDEVDLRIVGIFSMGSTYTDSLVIVPIDVARDLSEMDNDEVSSFTVETENPEEADKTALRIEMRFDDVDAQTQQESSEQIGEFLSTIRTFQFLIASLSAFVGGIGVLNTMLTSVSERTKEIGIMKAVGWTDWDVMKGIVLESTFLGALGGTIGIGIGIVVSELISMLINFKTFVSPILALEALIFAIVLGFVGGAYPARKAAKLSPIDALRFE